MRVVLESGRGIAVYRRAAPGVLGRDRARGADRRPLPQRARRRRVRPRPRHTHARGVTLLSVDRPGYGASDPSTKAGGRRWRRRRTISRRCSTASSVAGWVSSGGRRAVASRSRWRPGTPTSSTASPSWRRRRRTPRFPWSRPRAARRARAAPRRRSREGPRRARGSARLARARRPSSPEALWLLGAGQRRRAGASPGRCVGPPRRDAARRVRPGRARPRGRHRRLLPAAVGLRAGGRRREDAAPLRGARPARRPAARTLVAERGCRTRSSRSRPAPATC